MRVACIAALLMFLVSGCGENRDRNRVATPSAPAAEVEPALLTLADLPTGFRPATSEYGLDTDVRPCGKALVLRDRADAHADRMFASDELRTYVTESLYLFQNSREAESAFNDVIRRLRSCTSWGIIESGVRLSFTLAPLAFPTVSDQTYAGTFRRRVFTVEGLSELVLIRKAGAIVVLANTVGGLGTVQVDSALTQELARKADAKLAALQQR